MPIARWIDYRIVTILVPRSVTGKHKITKNILLRTINVSYTAAVFS